MTAKKRMRHISVLEDYFKSQKLHPDTSTNQKMMMAGEIWYRFAVTSMQTSGPQAIAYTERVSTSRTRMDVDRFLGNLVDLKKKAYLYRKMTSEGGRMILDAIIVEDLTIEATAAKIKGSTGKPARDEIRIRFKQALEDFAALTRVLGT